MLPDLVFDPNGEAGDQTAKDLKIDSNATSTGFQGHAFSSSHHDGYDVVILNFNDFDPGEQVTFSVDVDPTSIRGAPAPDPNESGSVSGLELTGSTVSTSFSNGLIVTTKTFRTPNSLSGSETTIRETLPPPPAVQVLGIMNPPASVSVPEQVLRITGPAWASVDVLVAEAGLFAAGVPGGGFDIEPFEANGVVGMRQYVAVTDENGSADVAITLTRSGSETGLNHIVAAFDNGYGMRGRTSAPAVLELE